MQTRDFPQVTITKKGTRWVEEGHPWVYEGEVLSLSADIPDGALSDVVTEGGKYLGTGFYNSRSKIRVRILSRNANDRFDEAFFARRVRYALDYRKTVMGNDFSCCRLIHGEADGFPGLTVDRYSNLLAAEVLSKGIEDRKGQIFRALLAALQDGGEVIDGLYERNEGAIRSLEGLEKYKGWYRFEGENVPASPVTEITENGIVYSVDVENGQKTGFFLDQKYNRLAVQKLSKGLKVLDCFTHTGSFALNAARGGAEFVTAVDVSETAIEMARKNAARNGLEGRMEFLTADVFDLLPKLQAEGGR
ncbi:MAG: class I SAM-dependent rRNA methyltransferase, partial [Lachnospiraceae bacterium]|nr:class I SAM-dependent rRNA methyltransferase [Lachnospiraceae bacterium]